MNSVILAAALSLAFAGVSGEVRCAGLSSASDCASCGWLKCGGDCIADLGIIGFCRLRTPDDPPETTPATTTSLGPDPSGTASRFLSPEDATDKEMESQSNIIQFVVHLTICAIFAYFYYNKVVRKLPELGHVAPREEELSLFACCGDTDQCCYTFCCLQSVFAKNMAKTGVMGFWPGWLLATVGGTVPCCFVLIRTWTKGKVQERLGHPSDVCMNFLTSLCCLMCDVGRESMEVDAELGVHIGCCCKVHELEDTRSRLTSSDNSKEMVGPANQA